MATQDDPPPLWFELGVDMDARMVGATVASSVSFDMAHDAVVVGWGDGMISTYDVFELGVAHSSFKAHPSPVKQIMSMGMGGLLSVSDHHVSLHGFGGAPYVSASLLDKDQEKHLTSVLVLDETRFVVGCSEATNGSSLYELDLNRLDNHSASRYVHKFRGGAYNSGVSILCPTSFGSIICGGKDGRIGMLDLRQNRAVGSPMVAHMHSITDLDLFDRTLITCGNATDNQPDPFVKLFDIRMLVRTLGVLQVQSKYVRFLPGYNSRAMLVGEMGNVQVYYDLDQGTAAKLEQIDHFQTGGGSIAGMAISSVGRAAAFIDTAGYVHLWSDDENWLETPQQNVNHYSEPIEDHPRNSFAASDKKMSSLELWDDMFSDIVNQSAYISGDMLHQNEDDPLTSLRGSTLPPLVMNKLVTDKNIRQIHPELLKRAQTKRDFLGQYIETRPDEFVMSHAMIFGKDTAKRAYVSGVEAVDLLGAEDGQPPKSPRGAATGETIGGRSGSEDLIDSSGSIDIHDRNLEKLLSEIPDIYRQPVMKLSNIGLADFDYGNFNSTPFAGLEAELPNCFANAVLQVLYFLPELRQMLLNYESEDPSCLATECGFLFHMFDEAMEVPSRNKSCIARNFLRAFRLAADAQALGLIEPTQLEADERTGAFIRFLLEQFSRSHKSLKQGIAAEFGIQFAHREKWLSHGVDDSFRSSVSLVLDLHYPAELSKAIVHDTKVPEITFCELLQMSFAQTKRTKLWSKDHNEQVPVVQTKTVTGFSDFLIVNAASHDNRSVYLPLYRQKGSKDMDFVPGSFTVEVDPALKKAGGFHGKSAANAIRVREGLRVSSQTSTKNDEVFQFELCAVVSHVYPANNIVAHVKVGSLYAKLAKEAMERCPDAGRDEITPDSWLLFNDICVTRVERFEDVVDFRNPWRNPCIFIFRQKGRVAPQTGKRLEDIIQALREKTVPDERIFNAPSLSVKAPLRSTFVKLSKDKLPKKGDLVAIDCEMVALSTEESYINEEGRKVVTSQAQLSLARLSCTLEDETVFIDDYIVTPEVVVDFLTRFSGLMPGDLDPTTSGHHLVTLRTSVLKLKRLIDRGCIFVGHGLMKDFRVINVLVPPSQIRDTVNLFHLRNNRFLSLSFLASYLLDLDIQGKTHDSIEDARTALRLFKEYKKLESEGDLDVKLREIYEQGRLRNFQ